MRAGTAGQMAWGIRKHRGCMCNERGSGACRDRDGQGLCLLSLSPFALGQMKRGGGRAPQRRLAVRHVVMQPRETQWKTQLREPGRRPVDGVSSGRGQRLLLGGGVSQALRGHQPHSVGSPGAASWPRRWPVPGSRHRRTQGLGRAKEGHQGLCQGTSKEGGDAGSVGTGPEEHCGRARLPVRPAGREGLF